MMESVIAISVGFFIMMCIIIKFIVINNIHDIPDIVDNTDNTDDNIQNTLEQNNQCKIIQNFEDVSINCIDVSIDTDIINHDLTVNNDDVTSDNDMQQLMLLIEPIEDNIKQVSENNSNIFSETFRILNFSAKHEKEIDLSGTTLISLRSIKQ